MRRFSDKRALLTATLLFLCGGAMTACPKSKGKLKTGKKYAKSWRAEYKELFDDELDARKLVFLKTDEPFAQKELKLLENRIRHADLVVKGNVANVTEMERWDGAKRKAVLIRVTEMLRGDRSDLPEGRDQLSLFLSSEQPEFCSKDVMGLAAVVFLRWRPKGHRPAFSWHLNFMGKEIEREVYTMLKNRAKREARK